MKKLLNLIFFGLMFQFLPGQNLQSPKAIYQQVEQYHRAGAQFEKAQLFQSHSKLGANQVSLLREVGKATLLNPDFQALNKVLHDAPQTLEMTIPNSNGEALTLELYKVNLFTPDFKVGTNDPAQNTTGLNLGLHYRGLVKGDQVSLVSVSIFENEIRGMISGEEGNYVLGKIRGNNPASGHILYLDQDLKSRPPFACATADDGRSYSAEELASQTTTNKAGDCVRIYLEADRDIYVAAGNNMTTAVNYLTGLFNQTATMYANESITFTLSQVYVWTVASPYTANSESQLLTQFQNYRTSFNGDLAALVNLKALGGIAAGFSGLCNANRTQKMCFAAIETSYNQVPTYSWSVMVLTHELGHLMGSRHTHACVWNGNNTAIDGCNTTEGGCPRPGNPAGGGTIMSYCHLTAVGINFNLGFGPQPGNVIRNSLIAAQCLTTCGGGGNTCSNGIQDGNETGIDCGGSCPACPTCFDGIQNGNETGIDCGGSCPACVSCAVPTGMVATNIRSRRANLNWSAVAGATNYTVQFRSAGGAWTSTTTTGTSVTASNLTNGVTYQWQVRTNCPSGSSAWSQICDFIGGNANSGGCASGSLVRGEIIPMIYPNPASQILNISFAVKGESVVNISVTDIMGRTLENFLMVIADDKSLDVSNYSPGIYFVTSKTSDGATHVIKFIVE